MTGSATMMLGAKVCPGTQVCLEGAPCPALFRCTASHTLCCSVLLTCVNLQEMCSHMQAVFQRTEMSLFFQAHAPLQTS